ncbi:hypothetical protein MKW92_023900, partial [Papaver armeniacum]
KPLISKRTHRFFSQLKASSISGLNFLRTTSYTSVVIGCNQDSLKIKASLDAKKETAINNFRIHCLDGDGGCGRVHKGRLESTNQVIVVKQFDQNGLQGNMEFLI